MEILAIRPAQPGGGNTVARFDIQLSGLRLFNLKLVRGNAGWRVYAPSAFGSPTATFTAVTGAAIARLAAESLGDIAHHDRATAAA